MARRSTRMSKAEETFVTLRELSISRGAIFRWFMLRRSYDAVSPPRNGQDRFGWKMTIGNMLRTWLNQGLVRKMQPGFYQFTKRGLTADTTAYSMSSHTSKKFRPISLVK